MSFDYTFGNRDGCTLLKIPRMPRKVCCMLFLHVLLSTTLSLFNSEVGTGTILYQFSGELVSALAEIHIQCDFETLQNGQESQALQVGPTISQQLYVHTHSSKCNLISWLDNLLGFPRRQRKARKLARKKRHIVRTKSAYKGIEHDQTKGFKGEGWQNPITAISNAIFNWWNNPFTVATWNTRSLTNERFKYAQSLGHDILTITELWRRQGKYLTKRKNYFASEPEIIKEGPKKGKKRFPNDRAAGVGILLSDLYSVYDIRVYILTQYS